MKRDAAYWALHLIILSCLFIACKKKSDQVQTCVYIPTTIDTTINLGDYAFFDLKTKGYTFTRYGSRRIFIHKVDNSTYKAFDRASSYNMGSVGCLLKVDPSGFYLDDTCSGSKFDFDGNVIQQPATCPLLEYQTSSSNGTDLRITHFP